MNKTIYKRRYLTRILLKNLILSHHMIKSSTLKIVNNLKSQKTVCFDIYSWNSSLNSDSIQLPEKIQFEYCQSTSLNDVQVLNDHLNMINY